MKKLVLEASLDNLDRVREFVDEELEAAEMKPVLKYLSINDWIVWRQGDPLREVTTEEEKVLLEAVQKANNIEGSMTLPKEDILDTLMGK